MPVKWQVTDWFQLIGAFSLVSDIERIHCQYLSHIEIYLHHQYSESVSNKNLALYWRQNSCLGTTLIFLVFSCCAIWRVITYSPLTFQQCFINTPQHLLSLLSKTLSNACSSCSTWSFLSPSHLKVLLYSDTCLPHPFQSHPNS